jgi:flagellar basal-body rod protein FlgC
MKIDRLFAGLQISARGMSVQRKRMEAIASNLANADTSRTEEGGPYRRKSVLLKEIAPGGFAAAAQEAGIPLAAPRAGHIPTGGLLSATGGHIPGGIEAQESADTAPPRMVYDPGHPDADANGYVAMPNINVVTEMVGMISATRSFEANVVAINAAKSMAKDSLEI